MLQFFCCVSLLIFTAYSLCGNNHDQSLLLSISINGKQVKRIGIDEYLTVVEAAAEVIVPDNNQRLGINTFGGITGSNAYETKLSMTTTSWSTVQGQIQSLSSEDYDSNWGNSVSTAVDQAIAASWGSYRQQTHVLFSTGLPLANNYGTATTPENFDDPCGSSVTAKQNNIQQYVVLIGVDGTNFIKEHFTCLVEDPDNDVIVIDPSDTSSGLSNLASRVCKSNGYDVKITEVNPVAGVNKPYIEVLNRGADASISVCWGSGACSTSDVTTGRYFVGYDDSGSGTAPSGGVSGLASNSDGASGWTAQVKIGTSTEQSITHGSTGSGLNWQTLITGRTFELRGAGYNSEYGANWRMSCNPKEDGSPGSGPEVCVELADSCTTTNCDLNGASSSCITEDATQNSLCQCDTTYFEDINSCIDIPVVKQSAGCRTVVIRDDVGNKDYVYFGFDKVPYDGAVTYLVSYPGSGGTEVWTSEIPAVATDKASSGIATGATAASITVQTKYEALILDPVISKSDSVTMTCSVTTQEPTRDPTTSPTRAPSVIPTQSPTLQPTYDQPMVFLSDICGTDRCECFDAVRTCCFPFGPDIDANKLTSGVVPDAGCQHYFKPIEVSSAHESDGLSEPIKIQKEGDTSETEVTYTIKAYNVINRTDFEDLEADWTDGYIPTTRRLINMDALEAVNIRRLLQATPSPTYENGNKLNILVEPPGESDEVTGTVMIGDGDTSADINLEITVGSLKCASNGQCPITYDECASQALAFRLTLDSCTATGWSGCDAIYPTVVWIMVARSTALCKINFGIGNSEKELPTWFWWVLLALLLFLLCLGYMVYRFWWKQKRTAGELGDAVDELDHQQADNEAGFGKDLDVGDVAFNPMATGVPGMNRPADAFGNELHQRQLEQQNDMVDVQAEIFQVRQDYGQVATGPRKDPNRGY